MHARVATLDELPVGTMKKVTAGETPCLVVRLADGVHAYPARCPHYDGPLHKGVLDGDRLVCPWHQAVYDAGTGDLIEPPSFSALPPYDVRVEGGDVIIELPDKPARARAMAAATPDEADPRTVVIVGAGAAGAAACEALRHSGYTGRITMLSGEDRLPYDRPNCSKDLLAGTMQAAWMPLRSPAFYEKHGVERRTATVEHADVGSRELRLDDGETLTCDALLLAPGSVARRIPVPGADLPGVFTLRSWDDCEAIAAAAESGRRAVIVGASFIGLEVAAALRHREVEVTVMAPEGVPFERQFGPRVGAAVKALHDRHGVELRLCCGVAAIEGDAEGVRAVQPAEGDAITADLVVLGVGARPATDFVEGIELEDDGGIPVNDRLRAAPGVWAAGDVALYPAAHVDEPVRIEHWRLALQHGRAAARDIAGHGEAFGGVPFFWSQQYDVSLGYAGYAGRWDEIVVSGDVDGLDFIAYYCAGDEVRGACGTRDAQLAAFGELMYRGSTPTASAVAADPDIDLVSLLR